LSPWDLPVEVSIGVRQNITEAVKLADTFGLDAHSTFLCIAGIHFGRIEVDVYGDTGNRQCDSHKAPSNASGRRELSYG
jgi:hypothetical protein